MRYPGTVLRSGLLWVDEFSRCKARSSVLARKERVEFAAVFMAAVYLGRPVVLANPGMGSGGVGQRLKAQLSPAW
jgi:hypothetical protein